MLKNNNHGFTIVELLIVIVVIGILAAISIVAYNGITERSRMAGAKSFESQFRKKYLADATGDWSFDECTGGTVKNKAGNLSSDVISGNQTWITDTPFGTGCALKFDGSTSIMTSATLGSKYYAEATWIRMSITSPADCNYNTIFGVRDVGLESVMQAHECYINSGVNGDYYTIRTPQKINDGKWHYVAFEWSGNSQNLYIDGNNVSSRNWTTPPNGASSRIALGIIVNAYSYKGDMDSTFIAASN